MTAGSPAGRAAMLAIPIATGVVDGLAVMLATQSTAAAAAVSLACMPIAGMALACMRSASSQPPADGAHGR